MLLQPDLFNGHYENHGSIILISCCNLQRYYMTLLMLLQTKILAAIIADMVIIFFQY